MAKAKQMAINRTFMRLLMCFIVLGYGFLSVVEIGDYGPKIERLQDNYLWMRIFLALLGGVGAISTFSVWGLMLYHWGTHVFKSKAYKRLWFLVMSFGLFVGAWFYYIIVFELGKTLIMNNGGNR